jgi:polyphosphate kinase
VKKGAFAYLNRELSWIEFNARVLDEAFQADVPLLERLRFLSIVSSNFDEFFMVRVASLKEQARRGSTQKDLAGLSPKEQLRRISARVHELVKAQYACLLGEVLPGLAAEGMRYVPRSEYSADEARFLESFFMSDVFPLLTPLRAGGDGAFPSLGNLRLHAAFLLKSSLTVEAGPLADFLDRAGIPGARRMAPDIGPCAANPTDAERGVPLDADRGAPLDAERGVPLDAERPPIAVVQIPASVPRVVWLPGETGGRRFTLLDDVVLAYGQRLFPGFSVRETLLFKVARDADFAVDEDRDEDFIDAMREVLEHRLSSPPVRFLCTGESPTLLSFLRDGMGLEAADIYRVPGPIDMSTLVELAGAEGFDRLRNPPWKHFWPAGLDPETPLWDELKRTDVLLHVPYASWEPVLRFLNDAADDPNVLAIKMTLYRTSGDSPVVRALERAARAGKHVTAFVELKARFDEERNISWAKRLEAVGVIVVYGIARLKVHAKAVLVVRREPDGIRRYVHLSTGNYNDRTARFYEDFSLFTANQEIANDATLFFNMISGYSAIVSTKRLVMAPVELKTRLLALIQREIDRSTPERPGLVIAKMNSLADQEMIDALYRASQAGVRVQLNVRGICQLVPGVPGMSERITVVSVIDRYLEHARAFWFENGGDGELYLSSADWMSRNLDRRVELMFPVLQESIRTEILSALRLYFADNVKAHALGPDGTWARRQGGKGEKRVRAQEALYEAERKRKEMSDREPQREFAVRRAD